MVKRIEYDERTGMLEEVPMFHGGGAVRDADVLKIGDVEYVPLRTAYWVIVQSAKPTSVTLHRCSGCRTTTYASRLPPYCSECGAKIIGKAKEENDVLIVQS